MGWGLCEILNFAAWDTSICARSLDISPLLCYNIHISGRCRKNRKELRYYGTSESRT